MISRFDIMPFQTFSLSLYKKNYNTCDVQQEHEDDIWNTGKILPYFGIRQASEQSKLTILEHIVWLELIWP